jgi:predicted PurR-regulated permease PerM
MRNDRPGCLAGLLELFLLDKLFDWLQRRFGFGRGCSCTGVGCGFILLILFIVFACGTLNNVDWTRLF